MSDTNAWVARRLREARGRLGWNQAQLASRLGITQTAVSYWESGRRSPGVDDLIKIADTLGKPIDYFIPTEANRPSMTALLRATADRVDSAQFRDALETLGAWANSQSFPDVEIHVTGTTPERAAEEVVEQAGVTKAPIPVHKLAKLCGALVHEQEMDDSISGLIVEGDEGAIISANSRHHEHRRRFSVAHELGHYLLQHSDRFHVDVEGGHAPGSDYASERDANDFAAELLMPRDMVVDGYKRGRASVQLARTFDVSEIAMGYRLVNLGLR